MKKIITVIILLIILVSLAVPAASSKEYVRAADSATVSQTVKNQLQVEDGDTVVCIYHMSIKDAFAEYDTVDQALLSEDMSGIYYAVIDTEGHVKYYENIDGAYHRASADTLSIPIDFYLEGNMQIWDEIGSDAIIYYRYFIYGNSDDSAVYYKTSQGEFVYYYTPKIGQNLFYLKDFIAYQVKPYPLPGTDMIIPQLTDAPISENPWFFLCAGAFVLLAGICATAAIIYRKKYKLYIPNSQTQEDSFDPDLVINHCLNSTPPAKQL